MKVETISYVKKNAATLDVSEPILVTQNGVPAYVIESYDQQQERENAIALLKLLTLSEKDKAEARVLKRPITGWTCGLNAEHATLRDFYGAAGYL
jgi:hypothetical protein